MEAEKFILSVLKKIESLKDGVIAYAYKTGNATMTHTWWEVSVSDFDLYMNDKRFKNLSNAWHKAAIVHNVRLVFVCGWVPTEERLSKLADENNLILNI